MSSRNSKRIILAKYVESKFICPSLHNLFAFYVTFFVLKARFNGYLEETKTYCMPKIVWPFNCSYL